MKLKRKSNFVIILFLAVTILCCEPEEKVDIQQTNEVILPVEIVFNSGGKRQYYYDQSNLLYRVEYINDSDFSVTGIWEISYKQNAPSQLINSQPRFPELTRVYNCTTDESGKIIEIRQVLSDSEVLLRKYEYVSDDIVSLSGEFSENYSLNEHGDIVGIERLDKHGGESTNLTIEYNQSYFSPFKDVPFIKAFSIFFMDFDLMDYAGQHMPIRVTGNSFGYSFSGEFNEMGFPDRVIETGLISETYDIKYVTKEVIN
ncbi:hypothetical protein SLH46_06300 [Draconibacterium sp. IB214405]|uniref:hypothetical protein n=1 Tax=Draconibacterium sp. IB214405 TaxID=3097352 RepID=UPI002A1780D5|nr:hypothetical protein [Draconibacterium sp. IB214405]MDX8338783.1 hypothetical protein [Draconibacterium sp. IB214405]